MKIAVRALDHLVLSVNDPAVTADFYRKALRMQVITFRAGDGSSRTALGFGAQKINLHPVDAPFAPHAARPVQGSADLCFLSDTGLRDWQAHLTRLGITVESGPVARSGATGPITSIYLRDPDGNLIEISNAAAE